MEYAILQESTLSVDACRRLLTEARVCNGFMTTALSTCGPNLEALGTLIHNAVVNLNNVGIKPMRTDWREAIPSLRNAEP